MDYCCSGGKAYMIITGILSVIAQVLAYALDLLPQVGTSLDSFHSNFQQFFSYVGLLNGWFPIVELALCISILWAAHSLEFVGNFIIWIYGKIPGKMT